MQQKVMPALMRCCNQLECEEVIEASSFSVDKKEGEG